MFYSAVKPQYNRVIIVIVRRWMIDEAVAGAASHRTSPATPQFNTGSSIAALVGARSSISQRCLDALAMCTHRGVRLTRTRVAFVNLCSRSSASSSEGAVVAYASTVSSRSRAARAFDWVAASNCGSFFRSSAPIYASAPQYPPSMVAVSSAAVRRSIIALIVLLL